MDAMTRIERTLTAAIVQGEAPGCPPLLAAAIRHAVFPGGARIRPRLCLAVARACGDDDQAAADAAATSIELLHCASLIHDDLPCFDDALTRRGKPSVHRAFGEPIAVLAGDALIVMAFQTLARGAAAVPQRLAALTLTIARSVGAHLAITGGMAIGDSLVQQVLGHGIAARLSARLGEGVLNGMLTTRIGLSAMAVCRPMPFAAEKQPGVKDVAPFLFSRDKL